METPSYRSNTQDSACAATPTFFHNVPVDSVILVHHWVFSTFLTGLGRRHHIPFFPLLLRASAHTVEMNPQRGGQQYDPGYYMQDLPTDSNVSPTRGLRSEHDFF